jgi:hypothetical protein
LGKEVVPSRRDTVISQLEKILTDEEKEFYNYKERAIDTGEDPTVTIDQIINNIDKH